MIGVLGADATRTTRARIQKDSEVIIAIAFTESINPEDLIIDVDKSFAKQLYKKWEMSVQVGYHLNDGLLLTRFSKWLSLEFRYVICCCFAGTEGDFCWQKRYWFFFLVVMSVS